MATAFTVGRVGTTLTDVHLSELDHRPGVIAVGGTLNESNPTVAEVLVEQMLGYVESLDEPYVPVTWGCAQGNTITGFYRVRDVSSRAITRLTDRGMYEFSIALERVRGFAAPLFEAVILGGKRAGVAAGVTDIAWQALPAAGTGYENGYVTPTVATIGSADGNLTEYTGGTNILYDARASFYLAPESHYIGAATLTVGGVVVTGRQVRNTPTSWTISNGVIRLSGVTASGAVLLERWSTGTTWVSLGQWQVGTYGVVMGDPLLPAPHALTVIRNSPECVTIRLTHDVGSTVTNGKFAVAIDYSLRRGSRAVEACLSTRGSYRWRVLTPLAYTGTVSGGGCTAAASNGAAMMDGNTEYLDPADPRAWALPAAGQFAAWGFGYVAGTVDAAAAAALGGRYAAAQTERVQVVAR